MTVPVRFNHMQAAQAILARIAFSGESLTDWREDQGIDTDALERLTGESSDDTVDEIEEFLRDGNEFSTAQLRDFLVREGMTMFQVGWICAKRAEQREREPAPAT
jgi:hypothetical protein